MPKLHDFDMDDNLIHKVNSKYYDIIDFPQIKKNSHAFSIFHLNIRSLSAHLEELQLLLNALKINFDVIGISETKEQSGGFLKMLICMVTQFIPSSPTLELVVWPFM